MKIFSSVAVCLATFCIILSSQSFGQSGTANGTYDFTSLGRDNSGGPGFKRQRDKFRVSNVFVQDGTGMYANNANAGASQQVIIKAEGGVINKNFTFLNLNLRNYAADVALDVFTITLRNYFGVAIATHQLAASQALTTTGADISTFNFTTPFPAGGYPGVAEIEINFHYEDGAVSPDEMTFSTISVANISGYILPLTLVNFEVKKEKSSIRINWSTANEKDLDRLMLEHSVDGRIFSAIADFSATASASSPKLYTYLHNTPAPGRNYYRLKEVGINGEEKTFVVKWVEMAKAGMSIVGANPVNGALTLKGLHGGSYNVNLTDLNGRVVYSTQVMGNSGRDHLLNIPANIHAGTYLLTVNGDGGKVSIKLVKQ